MDAALKKMLPFRKTRDVHPAALNDSRLGHRDVGEAALALRNGRLAMVEVLDESATEMGHLGERVWLTTLVRHAGHSSALDGQLVGLEVPPGIGGSGFCLGDQIGERGRVAKRFERDVVAEAPPCPPQSAPADRLLQRGPSS